MKLSHDTVKEMIPELISRGHIPDEMKDHLRECRECREEVSLLQALHSAEVPLPDGLFFESLPRRVRASLTKEIGRKGFFFRLAPVFAVIALIVAAGYLYTSQKAFHAEKEPFISESPVPRVQGLAGLNPEDISSLETAFEENGIFPEETAFLGEFASLSPEEIEELYVVLSSVNGGVL